MVAMAKREQDLEEIRAMTTEQMEEEVVDLKGELFLLRLKRSARQEFKNNEFSRMHKRIAPMLTVKREREIEQGINKRLSRKLDRKWKQSIVVRPPPSLRGNKEE
ncbi:50S ribosomal protein L29 chloroplastic [Zea mays]|uniref:Large ribosomal subunit protein uL29c n=2 Tax=Zea mays TaxID=4577 RepID=A0A1D6FDV3_MAIZE|nr:50S ribosomal protein L29 chloroplastic [Zea mays]